MEVEDNKEATDLTQEQTDCLLQFQDVTRIDDLEQCREILQSYQWNLEEAVRATLNMGDRNVTEQSQQPNQDYIPLTAFGHHSALVIPSNRPGGLWDWLFMLAAFPFRFIYSSVTSVLSYAWTLIRPYNRRLTEEPVKDIDMFIHSYEKKYGFQHPTFYRGTYSQALNEAKRDLKFLLVYLHCDDHVDTPHFCRETLSNSELINYISDTMLFWACTVSLPEGYRVSQALRENGYPFLATIVLRGTRMTVVDRVEGPVPPNTLIQNLQEVIRDNDASLIAARADRSERNLTQTIRQEQDEAYVASLRADQEKEKRKQEERLRKEREENEIRERELEHQKTKEEIRRQKVEFADRIPEEPPLDDPSTVRLLIKLPQGTRLERRFCKHDSLKFLYYYIFCHPESPDLFEVTTNFPRRVLPCQPREGEPDPPTFEDSGIGKSEMLFVLDLEA